MSESKVQCEEQVSDGGAWPRFHQCTRMAVNEEGGKHYCKQHTPSIAKAKADERYRQFVAKMEARHAAQRRPIQELENAVAQRDARIAELETAIRTYCADMIQEGYEMPTILTAVLAANQKSAMQGQEPATSDVSA